MVENRVDYIDALRAFAILGVVLVHTSLIVSNLQKVIAAFCSKGAMGVQLFFVVSALTLFMSMKTREKTQSTMSFYIRRFFRIAPLYYIGIIFYGLLDGFSSRYWAPNGITWIDIIENFFFLHGWTPTSINSVVPGGWSIGVEMCFYIFVPYLFLKVKNIKIITWLMLISLIASQILNQVMLKLLSPYYTESNNYLLTSFLYLWFLNQISVFLLGILLFFLLQKKQFVDNKLLSLFLLLVSIFLMYRANYFLLIPAYFIFGIAFIILAYSLSLYSNPLLVNRFTIFLGKISFSVYLWHFVIIKIVHHIFEGYTNSPLGSLVMYFVLTVLISLFIGYISYRVIEVPGMKLGSKVIRKYTLKNEIKNKQVEISTSKQEV